MNSEADEPELDGEMDIQEPEMAMDISETEELDFSELPVAEVDLPPTPRTPSNPPPKSTAQRLVEQKQREYTLASRRFRIVYWTTRLVAGLASGFLPFVVSASTSVATGLSVAIVISVVIDSVFDPKSRHQLYSRASDLLAMAQLKAAGDMEQYKEQLDIVVATEGQRLERLVDLQALIKKIGDAQK